MKWDRMTRMEAGGVLFCGLYFAYRWTGGAVWAALVSCANQSVWELSKMITVPYCLWAVLEFFWLHPPIKRYTVAKTLGLAACVGGMVALSYTMAGIVGYPVPAVEIATAAVLAAFGHLLAVRLMRSARKLDGWFTVAVFSLILLVVMYLSFTVNPPRINLFLDPNTGGYGIPWISRQFSAPV